VMKNYICWCLMPDPFASGRLEFAWVRNQLLLYFVFSHSEHARMINPSKLAFQPLLNPSHSHLSPLNQGCLRERLASVATCLNNPLIHC
jgi:hypothetical protein